MGNDRVANFGYNSSVFGQIERSLNGQNCFEDIDMKFKKSEAELAEISYLPRVNSLLITHARMQRSI